jgi:hypothetical protein
MLGTTLFRENKLWEAVAMISRIHYLGHDIFDEGIPMDPMKLEAIIEWPAPTNVLEIGSFMCLAKYSQRFVEGSSKIVNPIMELQKKNKKFVLIKKCAE